jgi:hypothetical protein
LKSSLWSPNTLNRLSAILGKSPYALGMVRIAKIKNGFPPKTCANCGLEFEWRKKWAKDWDLVKYCSERCRK